MQSSVFQPFYWNGTSGAVTLHAKPHAVTLRAGYIVSV